MARQRKNLRERKRQLALKLDASRQNLRDEGQKLRRRLSPSHAVSSYLRRHPLQVFGATSGGVALLTYILRPRARDQKPPRSLPLRLLGWVMALAKSAIRSWFLNQAKAYLRPKCPESDSLLGP